MTEDVSTTSLQGSQGLQQFLLLAKTAKGQAAVELVKQVLSASGVYVFGELLETECVKDLAASESNSNYVTLLEIFAYGTYSDYNGEGPSMHKHSINIPCMYYKYHAPSHTILPLYTRSYTCHFYTYVSLEYGMLL